MDTAFFVSGMAAQPRIIKTPRASASASDIHGLPDIQGKSTPQDHELTVLDPNQVANLLQCHSKTVLRLAKAGRIPAFRLGRLWRFSRAAIHQWIEEQGYNQRTVRAA